jgi:hypothetical protein
MLLIVGLDDLKQSIQRSLRILRSELAGSHYACLSRRAFVPQRPNQPRHLLRIHTQRYRPGHYQTIVIEFGQSMLIYLRRQQRRP